MMVYSLVTVLESGVKGLGYPCARCEREFDTAREADAHMSKAHQLTWSR